MVRHRENLRHGTTAGSDRWTTAGIWIVGVTAAAMSWTGWFLLAAMCGWPKLLAGLLPFAVDIYVITSARVWLRVGWVSTRTRRFAAGSTFFAVVLSIAANAAYHLMESLGWHRAPWGVVVAVSGLAPLMLALVAHLQARLNADRTAPAESHVVAPAVPVQAAASEATAEPEPEPEPEPSPVPQIAAAAVPQPEPPAEPRREPRPRTSRPAKDPEAERARAAYRKSVRQGEPLSDRALGDMYGRSRTWGANRIRETEEGPRLAGEATR